MWCAWAKKGTFTRNEELQITCMGLALHVAGRPDRESRRYRTRAPNTVYAASAAAAVRNSQCALLGAKHAQTGTCLTFCTRNGSCRQILPTASFVSAPKPTIRSNRLRGTRAERRYFVCRSPPSLIVYSPYAASTYWGANLNPTRTTFRH